MKKIGIVGGISWTSTLDYYKYINEGINQKLGGLNSAEVMIYSLNYHEYQKLDNDSNTDAALNLLLNAAKKLKNAGCEAVILAANTAHLVAEKLESVLELPLIHIAIATAKEINKKGIPKIGLLGTLQTMQLSFYKDKLREKNIETLIPNKKEDRDFIHTSLTLELGKGIIKTDTKQKYINIINNLIEEGAEGIILGCTEIPLLISQNDVSVPIFNTTKIHADAAVDFALSNVFLVNKQSK